MKISSSSWKSYIAKLSAINSKAANAMQEWIAVNGTADSQALVNYAYAVSTKYGEAAAALACEMYDATALLQKAKVPPAEPAPTATYAETAIAVNGAKMQGDAVIPQAVNRLVKLAGQDTTMLNARRDGVWWAWIPQGDTCAFCITLASRGWQRQSKKAATSHAEHIHANCDCAYAVSFSPFGDVEGYDPDKYLEMYQNASNGSPQDRVNALRRDLYAKNKNSINTRRRELYRRTKNQGAFKGLEEPMMLKHVKSVSQDMGITDNVKTTINRDENLVGTGYRGMTKDDGSGVVLFPDAFENRETLVKTIGHEQTHLQQISTHGKVTTIEELSRYEEEALESEEKWWQDYVKKTGYR